MSGAIVGGGGVAAVFKAAGGLNRSWIAICMWYFIRLPSIKGSAGSVVVF